MFRIDSRFQDEGYCVHRDRIATLEEAKELVVDFIKGPLGTSAMYMILESDVDGSWFVVLDNDECFALTKTIFGALMGPGRGNDAVKTRSRHEVSSQNPMRVRSNRTKTKRRALRY